jgi:hypothetical protein
MATATLERLASPTATVAQAAEVEVVEAVEAREVAMPAR